MVDHHFVLTQRMSSAIDKAKTYLGTGKTTATATRHVEHIFFQVLNKFTQPQQQHIASCSECSALHTEVKRRWQQSNLALQSARVPTRRRMTDLQWQQFVSDKRYFRLKREIELLLKKEEDAVYDAELYASCFTPNARRK